MFEFAGRERKPGDEGDPVCFGMVDQPLGSAVGEVVEVLYRDDRRGLLGLLELLDADLGQTYVADLPLVLQQLQLADLFGKRHLRVDAV